MAQWTNPSFEIELLINGGYRNVKVTLELAVIGTYEEPELEEDGAALLEILNSQGETLRELSIVELNSMERDRLRAKIAEVIAKTIEEHFDALSREIAEADQDRYYDMEVDRDDA